MISLDNLTKEQTGLPAARPPNGRILPQSDPVFLHNKPISNGFSWISGRYEQAKDENAKKSIREALCAPEIEKIEQAIENEAALMSSPSTTEERKSVAGKRIIEGMNYWQKLIASKID